MITINLRTLISVFSGTVIFFEASSNKASRSVKGLLSNPGIFFVEIYIFKSKFPINIAKT